MKKGFTLIELLAVIVILAIISLIATPIILGIIKNTQDSANMRSVENYAKAIENMVAKKTVQENEDISNIFGTYKSIDNKYIEDITNSENKYQIEYDGSEVKCSNVVINTNGTVTLSGCQVGNSKRTDYAYGTNNSTTASGSNTTTANIPTSYSTEEQVVGTWIDGRPLYQISLIFENLNDWSYRSRDNLWTFALPTIINDIERCISSCCVELTHNRVYPVVYPSANGWTRSFGVVDNTLFIEVGESIDVSEMQSSSYVITIQYTKTTDSSSTTN